MMYGKDLSIDLPNFVDFVDGVTDKTTRHRASMPGCFVGDAVSEIDEIWQIDREGLAERVQALADISRSRYVAI